MNEALPDESDIQRAELALWETISAWAGADEPRAQLAAAAAAKEALAAYRAAVHAYAVAPYRRPPGIAGPPLLRVVKRPDE